MNENKSESLSKNTVTIFIDDQPYQVSTKDNLLAGVLSQKLNLPYFCWHPSMGSVGACRQCAVTQFQDENDQRGRLVMACTTPVTDGMRISIKNVEASEFREQVIAAMMTNHPHDCPVCAEGGECHLQDMTVMTEHSVREYKGSKRTFTNQYLGELVGHEMNRCITCYRCTRFYNDYAGGKDFGVYGSKNQVYFGRQTDGALESEFSGNLVEVCPTGVFTNKVFSAHYSRKWDLQSAPSVCTHCSVGCNVSIGERYGSVRRVMNRYNADINGYFLCDRGRFGIGFVNGHQRIKQVSGISQTSPLQLSKLDVAKAFSHFRLKKIIAIGSARSSLEANFYLKSIVGSENFSAAYSDNEMQVAAQHAQLMQLGTPPDLTTIERSDFVLIVGEDISQTSPRIALSVRQALRNAAIEKASLIGIPSWQDSAVRTIGGKLLSPLYSLHSTSTKLDDVAEKSLLLTVDRISACLTVLAKLLTVATKKNAEQKLSDLCENNNDEQERLNTNEQAFVFALYQEFNRAKKPLIISGTSLGNARLLQTIASLMKSFGSGQNEDDKLSVPELIITPPCSNSVGLLSLLDDKTLSFEQVLSKLNQDENTGENSQYQGVIVLEQELSAYSNEQIKQLRKSAKNLIVLDHSQSRLTDIADIVLPVATVSEGDGHYVNYQGRAQKFSQVHAPVLPVQESWRWLDVIAETLGIKISVATDPTIAIKHISKKANCQSLRQLHQLFAEHYSDWPTLLDSKDAAQEHQAIARMTHRASGRTSQMANISVHESKTMQKKDDSLRFSMEGGAVKNTGEMPFTWAPGWNSNQSIGQYQEHINGPLQHQDQARFIIIPSAIINNSRWHIEGGVQANRANDVEKSTAQNISTMSVNLNYVQQQNVYLSEWQAAMTPEFQMLKQANQLFINAEIAEKMGIEPRQWCKVLLTRQADNQTSTNNENSQVIIAKVAVLDNLPETLAFGNFALQTLHLHNETLAQTLALIPANEQEVAIYLSSHNAEISAAEASKKMVLERLIKSDQTIPIRLVSGGLNDA